MIKNKVTLYIATHNKTGLKYFGKTRVYFTQEELQKSYHGSGSYWKKHLTKHGDDVNIEIYGIYSLNATEVDYVKPIALYLSKIWGITDLYNISGSRRRKKVWANEIPENGLDGGRLTKENHKEFCEKRRINNLVWHTEETKYKISEGNKNKHLSEDHKHKISLSNKNKVRTHESVKKGIASRHKNLVWHTEETKYKIGTSNKGKIRSEEFKDFLSKKMTGIARSEITKQKISYTMNSKLWKNTKGIEKKEKSRTTRDKNSRRYNVCKGNNIIAFNLTTTECYNIIQTFRRYTINAMSSPKIKNKLIKENKEQFIDCIFSEILTDNK